MRHDRSHPLRPQPDRPAAHRQRPHGPVQLPVRRHHGGEFLLRIEDTDRERSTEAATQVILEGLDWLGLTPDQPPVFQSTRMARHAEVARQMLAAGRAYHCYCTPEELRQMREQARGRGTVAALRRPLARSRSGRGAARRDARRSA